MDVVREVGTSASVSPSAFTTSCSKRLGLIPGNPLTQFHADIDKLWGEFRSGRIQVTGIPHVRRSGPGPVPSRVSIIPREWGDLSKIDHHEGDKDSIATAADTEPRYIKVRVPGDMVIAFWPEHQGPSLDDVLRNAANQAGGTLTQAKAEKIARGAEVYSSRNEVRGALKRLRNSRETRADENPPRPRVVPQICTFGQGRNGVNISEPSQTWTVQNAAQISNQYRAPRASPERCGQSLRRWARHALWMDEGRPARQRQSGRRSLDTG